MCTAQKYSERPTLATSIEPTATPAVVTISLPLSRMGNQASQFEVVFSALTRYRRELTNLEGCDHSDIISDIEEVQNEMMDQLFRITNNLIG